MRLYFRCTPRESLTHFQSNRVASYGVWFIQTYIRRNVQVGCKCISTNWKSFQKDASVRVFLRKSNHSRTTPRRVNNFSLCPTANSKYFERNLVAVYIGSYVRIAVTCKVGIVYLKDLHVESVFIKKVRFPYFPGNFTFPELLRTMSIHFWLLQKFPEVQFTVSEQCLNHFPFIWGRAMLMYTWILGTRRLLGTQKLCETPKYFRYIFIALQE